MDFSKKNILIFSFIICLLFLCQLFSGNLLIPFASLDIFNYFFSTDFIPNTKHKPPSISYNTLWYEGNFNHLFLNGNQINKKCPLCKFNVTNNGPNDSNRDLIITILNQLDRALIRHIKLQVCATKGWYFLLFVFLVFQLRI